jgi:hypothetical protein
LQASDIIFTLNSLILNAFILNSNVSFHGTFNCALLQSAPLSGSVVVESMEAVISHFVYPSLMLDNFPSNNYGVRARYGRPQSAASTSVDKYCVLSKF